MNHRVASGILGAADGVTSIAGVIAGGAASGTAHSKIAVIAIGGALAATVSMGGAELLSEDATDWTAILAMGLGTLGGSALPAIPLLVLHGPLSWFVVAAVSLAIGVVVGFVRAHTTHRRYLRAVLQTLAVLLCGGIVGYAAGAFV
jgi:VIT1/CCC1 family predicted Fe2+/Mn2+ transporter